MEGYRPTKTNVTLLSLEVLHIWKEIPRVNTRNEFRRGELTLKL